MSYMSYLLLLLVFVIFSYLLRLLWIRFTINRRLQEQTRTGQHTPHVPYFIRVRDLLSAQQEQQERSSREQAAECPPKYEDVFNAPGGHGHAHDLAHGVHAHNLAHGAHGAHTHGHLFSTAHRSSNGPGEGMANPGFTEEPPPDYSSAVASTQIEHLSEEATTNLPYQLANVHRNPYPAGNSYPNPAGNSNTNPAGNSLPYPPVDSQHHQHENNSSYPPGDQQRF